MDNILRNIHSHTPLVVDLDGTLIHTDMLHESALRLAHDRPLDLFRMPVWLAQGKAVLKRELAGRSLFDPAALPYNQELLAWLKGERAAGRSLILCTASDQSIANVIASYLGIFDEVIASDGVVNVAGPHKAALLTQRFGARAYDYVGNSRADLHVWRNARRAIVVNAAPGLMREAAGICEIECAFPPAPRGFLALRRTLRLHQWLKNVLLFVPLVAAHLVTSLDAWIALAFAFVSFSLCASTVYIANDLLDLDSDRRHPRKRHRPFAAGTVPAWCGVLAAPVLLACSVLFGMHAGRDFLTWLGIYFIATCLYSWVLKRLVLVDCLTLAMLYTLRIAAGAAAVGVALSFWLLAFSVFLFLSLAFVKRYVELLSHGAGNAEAVHGRGYYAADAPLVQMLGVCSGFAAVVVLALYLNSDAVAILYRSPHLVWGAVPVLLFWVSWVWLQAHRGNLHDDPLVFAIKDKSSLAAGLVFALVITFGARGVQW